MGICREAFQTDLEGIQGTICSTLQHIYVTLVDWTPSSSSVYSFPTTCIVRNSVVLIAVTSTSSFGQVMISAVC